MSNRNNLRPVKIAFKGELIEGYFHRFVYSYSNNYSETQALIELTDGRLRYFDPFYVQFSDRQTFSKESSDQE